MYVIAPAIALILATAYLGYSHLVSAQATLPAGLEVNCGPYIGDSDIALCEVQVPGEVIGADFDISAPASSVSGLTVLTKSGGLPLSSMFYPFQITGNNPYLIEVVFGNLSTQSHSAAPFNLFKFNVSVANLSPSNFPHAINGVILRQGSSLVTEASLATGSSSFRATQDIALPIILNTFSTQADADADGIVDPGDNCINTANPGQGNIDGDVFGDDCDDDIDGDGISNLLDQNIDGDLLANNQDDDDDGDGIPDVSDTVPGGPGTAVCGNNINEYGEQCDDGNLTAGDGCSPSCLTEAGGPACGNGNVDAGETCDDGNLIAGDGCSAACQAELAPTVAPPAAPTGGGGGGGGGGGIRPGIESTVVRCLDDTLESMTAEVWNVVCRAVRRGIISGNPTPDGVFFLPGNPINRAEVAKILTTGVLKLLGKVSDRDFESIERAILAAYPGEQFIIYTDMPYESDGSAPWFAKYVALATLENIFSGYGDGTFRASNNINNAESYKVIVETARVASALVEASLQDAEASSSGLDWFMKYAETLRSYNIKFSEDYSRLTLRKDFILIVMALLDAIEE